MMLLESTAGDLVKRALPSADQQGEVMMVLNERSDADAGFLRLLADPTSTGTFVLGKSSMPIAASKLRVLIATTNGPVEVLLLTGEDAAIGRCVACIGGTTETADIAAAYHAFFVVRPTVIESRFATPATGSMCRGDRCGLELLHVLAAHGLLAAGRLAQENDVADAVLWATGSVRPVDLTVGTVSHVPEKTLPTRSIVSSRARRRPSCAAGAAARQCRRGAADTRERARRARHRDDASRTLDRCSMPWR